MFSGASFFKTKLLLLLAMLLSAAIIFSAFTDKKTAVEQTKAFCLDNIKQFQAQLDTFQKLSEEKKDVKELKERFKATRLAFKRFEFLLEYLDNTRYPFFNGVNAIEMDEGYNPNAKPEGLQVMESELYKDSLDYGRLTYLTKQLKYRTLSFYLVLRDAQLRDIYMFEAMRFHLIRVETLSLPSFDSPNMRNNVQEIMVSLNALRTVLSFYKDEKSTEDINQLGEQLDAAVKYLKSYTFYTLDRLSFIKKYLQPATRSLMAIQQKLAIPFLEEKSRVFRAVNLKAPTIYDAGFLNVKFYAQDKYYSDNPLYTQLGKKLFFDTRLSAGEHLSCASCHKPDAALTDGLPTSITNKPGVFQQRNTPTILNAALQAAYFYDLAAVSLETQVNHVVVNPKEYDHSYGGIMQRLKADTTYVRLFAQAFPEYKENAISIYTINTCMADYERKFIFLNTPFDRYMRDETKSLDASVKRGFNLFMGKAQCGTCHFAPTFFGTAPPFYGVTESEVLGTTKTFDTIHPVLDEDIGRFKNFELPEFKYAMKTSTVRNAELTAPYMHNGGFKTLEEVVEFYDHGGGAGLGLSVPNQTLPSNRLYLSKQDKKDIISFIKALTDTTGLKSLF